MCRTLWLESSQERCTNYLRCSMLIMCKNTLCVSHFWNSTMKSFLTCSAQEKTTPNSGYLKTLLGRWVQCTYLEFITVKYCNISLISCLFHTCVGVCCYPRFGGIGSDQQKWGVFYLGERYSSTSNCSHSAQCMLLQVPFRLLCYCTHEGEFRWRRRDAQDWKTQLGMLYNMHRYLTSFSSIYFMVCFLISVTYET